ncbi:unnamed protein product [Prunus armeniaca]
MVIGQSPPPSQVHKDYGYTPCKSLVYRARALAVDIVEGTYSHQYEALWDCCHELKRRNLRTTIVIKSELEGDRPRFERLYICLAACKKGFFDGCRLAICLDGTKVKCPHPGQLLTDIGVDANNDMFPIDYVYLEIESVDSWVWFLELLVADLEIANSNGYVFMSDK